LFCSGSYTQENFIFYNSHAARASKAVAASSALARLARRLDAPV
jgi:hypothetical protein